MKTNPQIYVKDSIEAVEFYLKAFGATLGFNVKNSDGTYEHASIMVGDCEVLALSEDADLTNVIIKNYVMEFNVYDLGTEEAVLQAYQVMKEDAVWNGNPDGPASLPWNRYNFSLVDKYNISWWIAV